MVTERRQSVHQPIRRNGRRKLQVAAIRKLRIASLFSGLGIMDRAMISAGHTLLMQCELDQALFKMHCVESAGSRSVFADVHSTPTLLREADCMALGFPCVQFSSQNASRQGLRHRYTGSLLHAVVNRLHSWRPRWFVFENVPGFIHFQESDGVKTLTRGLEDAGYQWAYRVVATQAWGIP